MRRGREERPARCAEAPETRRTGYGEGYNTVLPRASDSTRLASPRRPTGVGRFCLDSLDEGSSDDTGREKGRENAKVGRGRRDRDWQRGRGAERRNERTDGGALVVLRRGGKEEAAAGAFDLGRGRRQSVRPLSYNGGPSLGCARARARESGIHVLAEKERER